MKDAITTTTSTNQTSGNSRNNNPPRGGSVQGRSALSQSFTTGPVPKLDFKKLKHVKEFKDWYAYASKLEDSVKYCRQRIKELEDDMD